MHTILLNMSDVIVNLAISSTQLDKIFESVDHNMFKYDREAVISLVKTYCESGNSREFGVRHGRGVIMLTRLRCVDGKIVRSNDGFLPDWMHNVNNTLDGG